MNNIELLEEILKFLNAVPNRKYGDNYSLASQLEELIEKEKINNLKLSIGVLDVGSDFRLLTQLDFKLASCLSVGDIINPNGTGFSFIIVDKVINIKEDCNVYDLRLNVIEYFTFWEKTKKVLFGIKPYSYWDFKQNKL